MGPLTVQLRHLGSAEFARIAPVPTRLTDLETVRTWKARPIYVRQDGFSELADILPVTLTPPSPGDQESKYSDSRRGYRLVARYPRPRFLGDDIVPTMSYGANQEPALLFVARCRGNFNNFIVWIRRVS